MSINDLKLEPADLFQIVPVFLLVPFSWSWIQSRITECLDLPASVIVPWTVCHHFDIFFFSFVWGIFFPKLQFDKFETSKEIFLRFKLGALHYFLIQDYPGSRMLSLHHPGNELLL